MSSPRTLAQRAEAPPRRDLARLEELREAFDAPAASEKTALLETAVGRKCARLADLVALHESLCFSRAYPSCIAEFDVAYGALAKFAGRNDVKRFAPRLLCSGIAGTSIAFRFYWPTAHWLARRWPGRLSIDWDEIEDDSPLLDLLPLLVPWIERTAMQEEDLPARDWLDRFRGAGETDAAFLIHRFAQTEQSEAWRERVFDGLDLAFVLAGGPGGPSRSVVELTAKRPKTLSTPRASVRPDMRAEILRAPRRIRYASQSVGRRVLEMARITMVTRERDLDQIAWGNPSDVILIDDEPGLTLAGVALLPERRFLLEGTYVFLVLHNDVPVAYMQGSGVFGWAEVNFNVFPPFRGRGAAHLYGRCLAALHHALGFDEFIVAPYQLGDGNEEAVASGAWWFYRKLGFRCVAPAVERTARREERRAAATTGYRTPPAILQELAESPMTLAPHRPRPTRFPRSGVAAISREVSRSLAAAAGADRERGLQDAAAIAAKRLGLSDPWAGLARGARVAWLQWAPLVAALPGVESWPKKSRRALLAIIAAKGGRHEAEYLKLTQHHQDLQLALRALAGLPEG